MMNAVDKLKQRSQGADFIAQVVHYIYDTYCVRHQTKTFLTHQVHQSSRNNHCLDSGEAREGETVTKVLHVIQDALSKGTLRPPDRVKAETKGWM